MFGFLKQKLADFGNKLKQTVAQEEATAPKTPEPQPAVVLKSTPKPLPKEDEQTKVPTPLTQPTQEKNLTKEAPKKAAEEKKTLQEKPVPAPSTPKKTPPAQPIPSTPAPVKKQGILGKLLNIGKKTPQEAPTLRTPVEAPKKKTKEEKAAELEAKMFAEIENEIQKETTSTPQEPTEILPPAPVQDTTSRSTPLEEEEPQAPRIPEPTPVPVAVEKPRDIHIASIEEDKRELKANIGVTGGLKGMLFGGITVTEQQISDLLWELELSLLESDVEQDAAHELVRQIQKRLVGTKVSTKNLDTYLQEQIKEILTDMMQTDKIDILAESEKHTPLKILILGPNGAGKTTSIAKLVHYFQKHNKSCIVAAADTFRAGAIDQLEVHAQKLGVRVIKQQYGADPAAVAFDAIKAAEANKIDVVLIDSAGRQETNKNLMEELRKIERVAKPDLKLYVGEAYAGQTLLEQVNEFKEIVGIDGFILTKIDTDAKGGTAISLLYKMKKPILFVGTGQEYEDFKEFTPEFVLQRII